MILLCLAYDNSALEFVPLDTSPLDPLGSVESANLSGRISLAWMTSGSNDLLTTDGKLFSVTFRVKPGAPLDQMPLTLSGVVTDLFSAELPAEWVNGAVDVLPYRLGDVNNNGRINIFRYTI